MKLYSVIAALLFTVSLNSSIFAQKEITLGSHANKGHSNTTIAKGEGIGMKIKTGKKEVMLQSLNIDLIDRHPDSVSFYLRLFPLNRKTLGNNIGPEKVFTTSLKDNQIHVSLADYHIIVTGDFVIGLEWAGNPQEDINTISFHAGLLKKGIYYKEADDTQWKKIPLFGFDIALRGIEN